MPHRVVSAMSVLPLIALVPLANAASSGADDSIDDIQVTATRAALPVMETPASVSIVTGDELRARAANDLRTALSTLAGVEISPGGDGGQAGAVPALWGLREFDTFLLVVDGVPWGGAFNPALTTLDLHNVDRIEVLRGAAPVMYGATSFVGVIHVIHLPAGQATRRATASAGGVAGNAGNVSLAVSQPLPSMSGWVQSINADAERQRFADQKAGLERGHMLYRGSKNIAGGLTNVDVDLNLLRQQPTSPYPRAGNGLDPSIDTDANFHPADARIDENRLQLSLLHQRASALGEWSTSVALTHTNADVVRGYLAESCGGNALSGTTNACGHAQDRDISDLYFDTHVTSRLGDKVSAVWGVDELFGKGRQSARIFSYDVHPTRGNDAPDSASSPDLEENELEVERNFLGAYGQIDWNPAENVNVILGLRINNTHEIREGEEDQAGGPVPSRETRSETEPSGSVGVAWKAWATDASVVTFYADYRDTFKPAAVDFGPEAEADILNPESAHSAELGMKSQWLDGRLRMDLAGFDMTMKNLVVPQLVNGGPGLTNAGTLHLKGGEAELSWHASDIATFYLAYAHHSLRFGDYQRLFDGVPTQLRGNSQELSPEDTGSLGFRLTPESGLLLSASYACTGERFLNKRNSSRAGSFSVLDAMLGYRFDHWEIDLVGHNLTNARDPVSESELGDGQYYRMPARSISVSFTAHL